MVLLEIMIYSGIIYGAVSLFQKYHGEKISPTLRYGLWFLVVLRLCVPFTWESGWHLIEVPITPAAESMAQPVVALQENEEQVFRVGPRGYYGASANTEESKEFAENSGVLAASGDAENTGSLTAVGNVENAGSLTAAGNVENTGSLPISGNVENAGSFGRAAIAKAIIQIKASVKEFMTGYGYWILPVIWAAGFIFCMGKRFLTGIRMQKIIISQGHDANDNVKEILDDSCKNLKINKQIPLVCLDGITTPALTVSFRPKLVLPMEMTEVFSKQQISHAIRHELTHYRRRDHLTCILLTLLECVYWFYPLVRKLRTRMIMDMETACDSQVVAHMKKEEKKQYAVTLLDMFAQNREPSFILGMAQDDTKEEAERRIRGIFQKSKSSRHVRVSALIMAVVLAFGCFTTACQPTPETPAVVPKGDGKLEEKMHQTQSEEEDKEDTPYEAPELLQMELTSPAEPDLTISINADVEVPDLTKYAVYRVSDRSFTQEEVDRFLELVTEDGVIYKTYEETGIRSREEIQKDIDYYTWELELAVEEGGSESYIYDLTKRLENLHQEYANTPEDVELETVSTEYPTDRVTGERYGDFWDAEGIKKHVYFTSSCIEMNTTGGNLVDYYGVTMTEEEAISLGQEFLSAMGVTCEVCEITTEYVEDYDIRLGMTDLSEGSKKWYKIEFVRQYPNTKKETGIHPELFSGDEKVEPVYSPWKGEETMHMMITDKGIQSFWWQNPKVIEQVEAEDVELLNFSQVQERLKVQLPLVNLCYESKDDYGKYYTYRRLEVDRLILNYAEVQAADEKYHYYLPVWDVCGRLIYGYTEDYYREVLTDAYPEDGDLEYVVAGKALDSDSCFLTLNAIDGSIIQRSRGY